MTTPTTTPAHSDGPTLQERARTVADEAHVVLGHLRTRATRAYFNARERVVGSGDNPDLYSGPLPEFGEVVEVDGITMRIDERMSEFNIRKLMTGRHTRHERSLVVDRLGADDIVMELGGGIGMVAISCAQKIGSDRVFSYEANPELESLIRDNYALNDVSPTIQMMMLGAHTDTRTFNIAERFSHSSAQLGGAGTRPVQVPVEPANEHLAETGANVLVVDIQGGEVEFFDVADLSAIRLLLVELHPFIIGLSGVRSVRSRLRDAGFSLIDRSGQSYLFSHPDR